MTNINPAYISDHQIFSLAAAWQAEGHQLALCFVMKTWGSSPRQAGSVMLVRDDHKIAGSVSGGCIEGAVIEAGLEAIKAKRGERLDFGVADETAWSVGLSCGGQIAILVAPVIPEKFPPAELDICARLCARRQPLHLSLDSVSGQLLSSVEKTDQGQHLRTNLDEASGQFLYVQLPPPHLIIIGATHIAQHLEIMSGHCGFQVTIIDPRGIFADEDRFSPEVDIIIDWPCNVLDQIEIDRSTAMVTLTHDPKIDDDGLDFALRSPVFYLASLGSRRTHSKRLERLVGAGFTPENCARIQGPAGLDIGAKSPAEIAVSIVAELVAAWRGHLGVKLPKDQQKDQQKDQSKEKKKGG